MITCDGGIAYGKHNVFYEMLKDFSTHFESVRIICPSNEKGETIKIHDNVTLHPSPHSKRLHGDVFRHKKFVVETGLKLHEQYGFDLIDAHFLPPLMTQIRGGLELSKKTGVPLIAEFMHLPGLPRASCWNEWMEGKIALYFLKKYRKKIHDFRIINRGEIGKYFEENLKISASHLHFISSIYLDFDLFHPTNETREPQSFIVAGRLAKNKGLLLIAEAVAHVREKYPQVTLKVVGEGEMMPALEAFIRKNALEKNIELLGWLPTQGDVGKLYNRVQASLMASSNEGGPRVVFESMACETPVLCTRVGESQEVIRDGENGRFMDWDARDIAQKMIEIIENPEKARAMGKAAHLAVQSWEKKKILQGYAEMLIKRMEP